MDSYHECLISKKPSGADTAKKVLIGLLGLALAFLAAAVLMFFFPLNLLISGGIFYGAYYLMSFFSVEYEYIITNDEIDFDKITGKRKRKRLVTAPIKKFERFGKAGEAPELPAGYTLVLAADGTDTADYFCDFNHDSFGNVRVVFTPDEKTVECISEQLPSLLKAELKRRKFLDK